MSGVLGVAGKAVSVVSGFAKSGTALAGLVAGNKAASGTPKPGTVMLGPVTLSGHEAPDKIPWGTTMGVVEHLFLGGEKFYTLTGPERPDISWTGKMLAADAVARCKVLDALCAAGKVIPLRWGSMAFTVIIQKFSAEYRRENWTGQYTINLKVFWNYAPVAAKPTPAVAAKAGIGGALASAAAGLGAVVHAGTALVSEAQGVVAGVSSVITPITSALGIHLPLLTTLTRGLISAQGAMAGLGGLSAGTSAAANVGDLFDSAQKALSAGVSSTGSALTSLGSALDLTATTAMAGAQATMAQAATGILGAQAALGASSVIPVTATTLAAPPGVGDASGPSLTIGTPAFAGAQQAAAAGLAAPTGLTSDPSTYADASAQLSKAIDGYRTGNAEVTADAAFDAAHGVADVNSPQELFKQLKASLPPGETDGNGFQLSTNGVTYTFNQGVIVSSAPGSIAYPPR